MSITFNRAIRVNGLPDAEEWRIEVHPAKEGGYWGEVPALRGCASFGATRAECRANVREAAQGCLEVYFEEALKSFSRRAVPSARQPLNEAAQVIGRILTTDCIDYTDF